MLTRSTYGEAEADGLATAAMILAFRGALRNLMAEEEFVNSVVGRKSVADENTGRAGGVIVADAEKFPEDLGGVDLIARVRGSVVTVVMDDGWGSGFLISSDGHVVTNAHVVGGRDFFDAILLNGIQLRCSVLYVDDEYDVALLKIEGANFPALPLGNSDAVRVGQNVFSVGAPMKLSHSVSRGIISGTPILEEEQLLQTDAQVSPGNSGGPLLNDRGEVIGVVTQKIVDEGVEGVSFALPINRVIEKLNLERRLAQGVRLR